MKTVTVMLSTISEVKPLSTGDAVRLRDRPALRAAMRWMQSPFMGIFSLDLTRPIQVNIHSDDCEDLLAKLTPTCKSEPVYRCALGRRQMCRRLFVSGLFLA
jgi:hypothetical protein